MNPNQPLNVLIVGGSDGIGLETGALLCERGHCVKLVARDFEHKPERALRIIARLNQTYGDAQCRLIRQDVSRLEELESFSKGVKERVGPLDGFVYCAGAQKTLPLAMTKPAAVQELFTLNTFAAMELVRCFSKVGFVRAGASFVLLSSLAPHESSPGKSAYAASKAALEGFVASASTELMQKNIRLNAIAPGIVKTSMSEGFLSKMTVDQVRALEDTYPLGFGEPEDVAWMIEFLLSPRSRWVSGKTFLIDGGHLPGGK